jgi:hypothetical protein
MMSGGAAVLAAAEAQIDARETCYGCLILATSTDAENWSRGANLCRRCSDVTARGRIRLSGAPSHPV